MSDERNPQADRFIPYLKGIFDLGSTDRVWVDAAGSYPNLLDAETKELLGTDFVDSTTDVAVIKGSAIRAGRPEKGLVLLFDIRQHLQGTPDDFAPSKTRVLTDLVDKWYLFWMDADILASCHFSSAAHAMGPIDALLTGQLKAESRLGGRRQIALPPMEGKAMPDSWK
ncbi:g8713 [Coccomyxa viridis]|uniref:G8713 protein n=1 Tax=Coccomyxa viridis TaxID=1274662 RepID=A0ABP1G126_9CHLO